MAHYFSRYAAGCNYFICSIFFLAVLFFIAPAKAAESRELSQQLKTTPVQLAYYVRYYRPYYRPYYHRPYYRPYRHYYYRPYYYHWRRW